MEMFEMLGLTPQNHLQPTTTVEAASSQFTTWRKPKWSRPGHTIDRNLEASAKESKFSHL
jgi:biotin synthase